MNIEALDRAAVIEAVTAEVMKQLEQLAEGKSVAAAQKQAVLLTAEPMPELENKLKPYYEVRYYDETLRDCDVLIIPSICIQLLAHLANGISAGPRERFVLMMLLKGRKVIALEEGLLYRKYKSTAPVLLYKMYDEFAGKLSNCGIRIANEAGWLAACLDEDRAADMQAVHHASSAEVTDEAEVLKRKVITEAEVKKHRLRNGTEIIIDRHSIITPLAQDYLRMQQMQVRRR